MIGIRRSGKSTLMKQIQAQLIINGVKSENTIFINFEDPRLDEIDTAKKLYELIAFYKTKIKEGNLVVFWMKLSGF